LYLWHGSKDAVVLPKSAYNSYNFLRLFAPKAHIYLDNEVMANHGVSSLTKGTECGVENTGTFVEHCNVSTVNRMLNHLFGPRSAASSVNINLNDEGINSGGQLMGQTKMRLQELFLSASPA
jgi:hypothetical protein